MAKQLFEQPEAIALPTSLAAITGGSAEVNLWTPTLYTPIPANYATPGMQWVVEASGILTLAATPGTITITPRIGTSGTPASNTTLGASNAATGITSTNVPWFLRGILTCRSIGLAGANSTFIFAGMFQANQAVTAGITFGGTLATVDSTIAQALAISITPSVTTQSWTVQQISWRSLS